LWLSYRYPFSLSLLELSVTTREAGVKKLNQWESPHVAVLPHETTELRSGAYADIRFFKTLRASQKIDILKFGWAKVFENSRARQKSVR